MADEAGATEGGAEDGPAAATEVHIQSDDARTRRLGLGMLLSLGVGYGPLRDAVTGAGSFEGAIGRYLLCLGASVGAVMVLGQLLDGAPPPADDGGDTGPGQPSG